MSLQCTICGVALLLRHPHRVWLSLTLLVLLAAYDTPLTPSTVLRSPGGFPFGLGFLSLFCGASAGDVDISLPSSASLSALSFHVSPLWPLTHSHLITCLFFASPSMSLALLNSSMLAGALPLFPLGFNVPCVINASYFESYLILIVWASWRLAAQLSAFVTLYNSAALLVAFVAPSHSSDSFSVFTGPVFVCVSISSMAATNPHPSREAA